jgi:hypothetical protein
MTDTPFLRLRDLPRIQLRHSPPAQGAACLDRHGPVARDGLARAGAIPPSPRAKPAALTIWHTDDYVTALETAERSQSVSDRTRARHGLGTVSNPVFPEMFRRPATAAGTSLLAGELLAKPGVIYHPGGGTHHGFPDRAAGFCYLNDPVLAILSLRRAGVAPDRLCRHRRPSRGRGGAWAGGRSRHAPDLGARGPPLALHRRAGGGWRRQCPEPADSARVQRQRDGGDPRAPDPARRRRLRARCHRAPMRRRRGGGGPAVAADSVQQRPLGRAARVDVAGLPAPSGAGRRRLQPVVGRAALDRDLGHAERPRDPRAPAERGRGRAARAALGPRARRAQPAGALVHHPARCAAPGPRAARDHTAHRTCCGTRPRRGAVFPIF